ncbi:hypothetical protein TCAL_07216 [Tigriopus californicus]|uniref:eIF-4F 25 kDa subunit n=1 Tax=Tigriopus californicus TaxID=6832 RepID=A0A553NNW3_TIGCA|nr:eukaryotic translation initiation factor 4E type 2-like [Tigriopus californicus]TRY67129.1 hypothetical protein TCAL_07216 [Tigriopus californicus]|eukprot:TCALIF_07216-PA protein Name:"Similar to EIF4E2 Eukaryotic translation initiation factor 4E type 2 (Homo sapiens)" AED:0.19 eAED:0.19 QI:0/0/0/0.5/1/1/4/0/221
MASNKFQALGAGLSEDEEDNAHENIAHTAAMSVKVKPLEVPPDENPLQSTYCLWFTRKPSCKHFDQSLRQVGRFASCEQFWRLYSHLVRPGDLQSHSDFHLFKEGIKPMWEDEVNRYGGKWIVRLRKGLASRCWENLILAMLGEQFMVGDEVCGAVVSIRSHEDILSIWNRSASDSAATSRIRDTFRRVLNLPPGTHIEYKAHNDSIKDLSSFRNTDVFTR